MIITDRFVYIHQPKTGGTFVTAMIERLYGVERQALATRRRFTHTWPFRALERCGSHPVYGAYRHTTNKHETARDIPRDCRDRPILGTLRNPFDHYVSQYRFGWWKRDEYASYFRSVPALRDRFPSFPDVEFGDYFALAHEALGGFDGAIGGAALRHLQRVLGLPYRPARRSDDPGTVGLYTSSFVNFFSRRPRRILRRPDRYADPERFREELFEVHFIRTGDLNRQLHAFLYGLGYAAGDIGAIPGHERVFPQGGGRSAAEGWQTFFTPELVERVRRLDRLVLACFPDLDVADPRSAALSDSIQRRT